MPHPPRHDADGRYFHVMNRGIARRPVFERRADFRFFLSRVAWAVRRGELEVLAYVLMGTHYHLLVRSRGHLSTAMRRIHIEFVRWFNRSRRRDGPLFRGRFRSKPVRSSAYLRNLYLYILENPVDAGLARHPVAYPWSSAAALRRKRSPQWLATDWLRRLGLDVLGESASLAPASVRRDRAEFVERRMEIRDPKGRDTLDVILDGAQSPAWMIRNARLADGFIPEQPVAGLRAVRRSVDELVPGAESIVVPGRRRRAYETRVLLRAGLLRDLAGATLAEIARELGCGRTRATRLVELHARILELDDGYRDVAQRVINRCLNPLR